MRTAPEFAVENHAAADTRSERDAHHVATTTRRAEPHLSDRGGIRVVLEKHGPAEPFL
jgi:hypothetical protein